MSELILETATHPGLCPGFYSISLYLPDWACSVFHRASALAEAEGHTTFRPQRKSCLCAIHDNLYLVYKTCTQCRKIKSVISHICDWNVSHGARQKNITASWKMVHYICQNNALFQWEVIVTQWCVLKITVLFRRLSVNFIVHAMELLGLMISMGHNLLFQCTWIFICRNPLFGINMVRIPSQSCSIMIDNITQYTAYD